VRLLFQYTHRQYRIRRFHKFTTSGQDPKTVVPGAPKTLIWLRQLTAVRSDPIARKLDSLEQETLSDTVSKNMALSFMSTSASFSRSSLFGKVRLFSAPFVDVGASSLLFRAVPLLRRAHDSRTLFEDTSSPHEIVKIWIVFKRHDVALTYDRRKGGYVSRCLFVCPLATLRRNFRTDLHEIFREGWQWANEQTI